MKVSVVKCNDYEQKNVDDSIKEALNLINFKFKEGIKVLLKPNLIGAFKAEYAVTTHPSIIIALCKILKEKNTEIYLGDSQGIPNIKKVFEITGMEEVAKKYNIKLVNFNSSKTIKLKREQNKILKESSFPDIIEKVDLIINLPKLKTHVFTQYTGAIKNLYGFIIGGKKSHYHLVNKTEKKFSEMLIDIHDLIKPQLTITDAVIGM
ncbi:MAG: DUF362 domain-containing protein, partial [Nanoarchaeota archaeon]|nr:DUF362 domain-containing protein [Nanoarchaeota archaeon]